MRRLFVALALLILPSAMPALAQTRVLIPCGSGPPCCTTISGHIDAVGPARLPWVVNVPVPAGICLYVETHGSDTDNVVSVIAPDGKVFRKFLGHNLPNSLEVSPTISGWYTIQYDTPAPSREQLINVFFQQLTAVNCGGLTPGR